MIIRFEHPPTIDDLDRIARDALSAMPAVFARHLEDVVLLVEEVADQETLDALNIKHPLDLTGVYEGIPISDRSVEHSGTLPDRIRLFRRAILDEWIDEDESLERLVRHILIHEAGHHFGFSDEAMHALEAEV